MECYLFGRAPISAMVKGYKRWWLYLYYVAMIFFKNSIKTQTTGFFLITSFSRLYPFSKFSLRRKWFRFHHCSLIQLLLLVSKKKKSIHTLSNHINWVKRWLIKGLEPVALYDWRKFCLSFTGGRINPCTIWITYVFLIYLGTPGPVEYKNILSDISS